MTLMRGSFDTFTIEEVMAVAGLSRQNLVVELVRVSEPAGEIQVKAGRVLMASHPDGTAGLDALRALLADPGDKFTILRLPPPLEYGEPLGTVSALVAGSDPEISDVDPTKLRFILTDEEDEDDYDTDEEDDLDPTFVFSDLARAKRDLDGAEFIMREVTPVPAPPPVERMPVPGSTLREKQAEGAPREPASNQHPTRDPAPERAPAPAPTPADPELVERLARLGDAVEELKRRRPSSLDRLLLVALLLIQGVTLVAVLAVFSVAWSQ